MAEMEWTKWVKLIDRATVSLEGCADCVALKAKTKDLDGMAMAAIGAVAGSWDPGVSKACGSSSRVVEG